MKNYLEYKGYHAKVEFDYDDQLLIGTIDGIRDLVTFQATSTAEVEKEFQLAVDDYLDFCRQVGKEPEKEYRGTFNIRISPELHRAAATAAYQLGLSLNQYVSQAISDELVRQEP